jgi:hypothetical protein
VPSVSAAAAAEEVAEDAPADQYRPWTPLTPSLTASARSESGFHGLFALDPVRLHLIRGGHADGPLGGVDPDKGAVLLLQPLAPVWIDLTLLTSVTPLRFDRPQRDEAGALLPEPLPSSDPVGARMALRPTWRSHLGVLLSALLPGTGQFIQEDNRRVGWVFLAAWSFVVSAGVLALSVPPQPAGPDRIAAATTFFAVGAGFNITAAIHAFRQGRRRVVVPAPRRR